MTSINPSLPITDDLDSQEVFIFPASFAQQRLWFLDRLVPENPFYNVSAAICLRGQLNLAALEQAFNEIIRRHEALRTTFAMVAGQLTQIIAPSWHLSLTVIKLQEVLSTEEERIAQMAAVEAQRPFDLTAGPLLRVKLLQLDETDHVLLLNLHHIVSDGWSMGVLIKELRVLYAAFLEGKPSPLAELPIQYADFAHWQRECLQGQVLETQLSYWRQQLKDISVLNLPTDRTRPIHQSYRGSTQLLELSKGLTESLLSLSERSEVSLFMTLLAAFQTLLYRYTRQTDIAVGSPIANRNRTETEGLIGFFVNSLVLRTNLSGNPTFRELLSRVREVALAAYAHQDLPFEKLVEELRPTRDLSRNPLFSVVFALQNAPLEALELPGLTLSSLDFETGTTRFDLEFHVSNYLDNLICTVVYSTDLFEPTTITRLLHHFQTLLEGIVTNSDQRVANLPLLTAQEHHQLVEWNDTQAHYTKDVSIHELIEFQVEQTPDATAIVFENQQLTYRELNQRANQLAHHLQKLGVGTEALIGVCVERSLEMVIGILGILKAGGAYLPLDPSYPRDRLSLMLADAQVTILLTSASVVERIGEQKLQVICLDRDCLAISEHIQENPTSSVTAKNLAYVIYTSGSTGKPKGVLVEHQGLSNLAEVQSRTFNIQPGNRILQFASLSFDASIFEIVMALGTGATLYLASKDSLLPGANLLQFLHRQAITHVTLPPSLLAILPSLNLPALKTIVSAGEACSSKVIERWAKERRFFNAYGPTEATVWATVAQLNESNSKPSIGRPIANTQIHLLDVHLQPVSIGVTGELYIGGDGLARGYFNRPELTALAFIPNPFSAKLGARLYKTGDLARYQPDGNIEFLGRIDEQVKIRGFRIELGEIETVLSHHPAVQEVVVTVREHIPEKRLVAYVVLNQQTITPNDLRCFLLSQLPEYLVPSAIVILKSLPLTPNGKVDRTSLPAPGVHPELEKSFVAPRTTTEQTLANIWAQLLNLERVGIDDNFFDLGGDSLLAMHLMERVQQQFGRELLLSSLFLFPTVAQLAKALSPSVNAPSWSPLVPLQPTGAKQPFFCIHPIFGVVMPYLELARHLGHGQPFYGLQPFGLDANHSPYTRIEEMAASYIQALRVIQPQEPYFLGGWSFGGLVAFEMAQQLQKAGHQVALLALLDTLAPVPINKVSLGDSLKFLLTTVAQSAWPFLLDYVVMMTTLKQSRGNSPTPSAVDRRIGTRAWRFLERAAITNLLPQESRLRMLNELTVRPMLRVYHANSQAAHNYAPQIYSGQITLFRSSEPSVKAVQDFTLGWSELTAAAVDVHQVPGNHFTMLRKPHVQILSEQLQKCIETQAIANY